MSYGLVVQCYIKVDTLDTLCKSLLECDQLEKFNLIFWIDKAKSDSSQRADIDLNSAVVKYIDEFTQKYGHLFSSVETKLNEVNLGTCKTCQTAVDYAFSKHDFVAFTEDDTVFAKDALSWGMSLYQKGILNDPDVIALAGESIYFDARRQAVDSDYVQIATAVANNRGYYNKYTKFNFVPSTCFFTTKDNWDRFGAIRGRPRGDEEVCDLCREENLFCVFPIVARVKDVGMLHEKGYSVRTLGAENVAEIKNTYLMADYLVPYSDKPEPFTGNAGRLFEESVKMFGFKNELARPAVISQKPWKLWCFSLKNFGDALTPAIFRHYGVPFELVDNFEEADLLGIGSNLDRVRSDHHPIVVWSSGYMYPKTRPISYREQIRFLGVRGEHTAALVKPARPSQLPIGDGGLLVRNLVRTCHTEKKYDLGIIPHMSDVASMRRNGMDSWPGTKIIDVLAPINQVLNDIAACRRIASSSLHGIITADAFGIPNCQLIFSGGRELEGDGFKYEDYSSALGYHMPRTTVDESATFSGVVERLDIIQPKKDSLDPILSALEMTVHLLRGDRAGLCVI